LEADLSAHVQRAHHFLKPFGELHVIAVCFNPLRYVSRYTLLDEFLQRSVSAGAVTHVAEASFGDRPTEIKDRGQQSHWHFRTSSEIWLKESMINAAVSRLPPDWKYVAWVDADVAFTNPHWVQETIQQLQHYSVVQMWHTAIDLDPSNLPMQTFKGYPASALENPRETDHAAPGAIASYHSMASYYYHTPAVAKAGKPSVAYWHPGYAWACTRDAWNQMGGLLDINIVGGGDHQMAKAFYGTADKAIPFASTAGYRETVMSWQEHALGLKQNVGFVPGTLMHYWHGQKVNRGYFDRWQILADNDFDPRTDLRKDWQGLWQLAGNKPKLRDDLRAYLRQRNEDSIDQ
jgi:hypothetical protein